jgi:hypothetical protein
MPCAGTPPVPVQEICEARPSWHHRHRAAADRKGRSLPAMPVRCGSAGSMMPAMDEPGKSTRCQAVITVSCFDHTARRATFYVSPIVFLALRTELGHVHTLDTLELSCLVAP